MILIVDDDKIVRLSLSVLMKSAGYNVCTAGNPSDAIDCVRKNGSQLQLVIMDMNYGRSTTGQDGLELLQRVKVLAPHLPVILITAWGSIPLAVEGMKLGAFDFITKPWDNRVMLQHAATAITLGNNNSHNQTNADSQTFDRTGIIGEHPALLNVLDTAARVAPTDAPVLILGENGTGKELVAQAIHRNSLRSNGELVMTNLGGISQSLFESEMFGHVKGAYTGATTDRKGRFELADKGTIFLDEIGDLDLTCQVKLLRVLQQHTFERLGDSTPRHTDIRVISATNANLWAKVTDHTFREDLLYRINLITLRLPALRERKSDIPLLVNHFATTYARENHLPQPEFHSEAMEYLTQLPWPGNIRELKNLVERTILVNGHSQLTKADFSLPNLAEEWSESAPQHSAGNATSTLDDMERRAIELAMKHHNANISKVAASLGVTRQTLYRKLEKFNIPH